MTTSSTRPSQSLTEAQVKAITDQVERLLDSAPFRTSQRCSTLLRFTVEAALEGRDDQLRERQIGIKAFQRRPGYDSDADPIVRVAAGDVRKRLAQYYNDSETLGQIRIELPIGSYVPIFHFSSEEEASALHLDMKGSATPGDVKPNPSDVTSVGSSDPRPNQDLLPPLSRRWVRSVIFAFTVLLVTAGIVWVKFRPGALASGFDDFWAPVISAQRQPLICVGEAFSTKGGFVPNGERSRFSAAWTEEIPRGPFPNGMPVIMTFDNLAAAKVAGVLGRKSRAFDVLGESETSFNDLLSRPIILIGSYNNDWTIRVTDAMRFRFEMDLSQHMGWISDRARAAEKIGVMSYATADPPTFATFAIVARAVDPTISRDQPIVVVAGQTSTSTKAAAEFVSDPSYLNDFAEHAPQDWNRKNVEFLITIPVVDNVPGHPRIVAYNLW